MQGSLEPAESLEGPDSVPPDDDWLMHAAQPRKPRTTESETQLSEQSSTASLSEPLLKES